jgi:hypothetical protein
LLDGNLTLLSNFEFDLHGKRLTIIRLAIEMAKSLVDNSQIVAQLG